MRVPPKRIGYGWRVLAGAVALGLGCAIASAETPEENYNKRCLTCHGQDGSGNGPAAKMLNKHPGNFADCDAMKAHDRAFLVEIIAEGGPSVGRSSQMPGSSKNLSAAEIEELADYVVKRFCRPD